MLPTVDFCFKELMKNDKVRKGFVAALLGRDPETIRQTTLIPNELRKESEDEKLGILDVLVELEDGSRMNIEMQVPYFECWTNRILFYVSRIYAGQIQKGQDYDALKKCIHVSILGIHPFSEGPEVLPEDHPLRCGDRGTVHRSDRAAYPGAEKAAAGDQNETGIIRWMRFLNGKSRKVFDHMAEKDEYIREACGELKKLSLDEQKRIEYEQREKAIRDYNSQMHSAERRGIEIGEERGKKLGEKLGEKLGKQNAIKEIVTKKLKKGFSVEEIAEFLEPGSR